MDLERKCPTVSVPVTTRNPMRPSQSASDFAPLGADANNAAASTSVPKSDSPNSFSPATSTESLGDEAYNSDVDVMSPHHRAVSVPTFNAAETDALAEEHAVEEGLDAAAASALTTPVNWEAGECALDDSTSEILAAAARSAVNSRVSDVSCRSCSQTLTSLHAPSMTITAHPVLAANGQKLGFASR